MIIYICYSAISSYNVQKRFREYLVAICFYYTSRENTLIPLDESHVSRLLATCVSVGSVTAGATQGVAPAVKETTY